MSGVQADALAELEQIRARLAAGRVPADRVAGEAERAAVIVQAARRQLRSADSALDALEAAAALSSAGVEGGGPLPGKQSATLSVGVYGDAR